MQHKEPTYIRKANLILHADTRAVYQEFKSISQAKRFSSQLQRNNGGLGVGYLRVER